MPASRQMIPSLSSCNVVFTFLYSNTTLQKKIYKMEAAKPAKIYSSPSSFSHFFCKPVVRMVRALDPFLTWRPTSCDCLNPLAYLVAAINMRVQVKSDHLAAGMLGIGNVE